MPMTLTIRDETTAGDPVHESVLEILTERITVQELIRSRVYQEVKDHNLKQADVFQGLIQPSETEKTLNGYKMKRKRQLDWKKQYETALEAYQNNQTIILVGDKQAEGLEEEIVVAPETQVTFLKLIPLVGG